MAQTYSVEAILKATDKNFSKVFGGAEKKASGFKGKISTAMKVAGVAVAAGTAAAGAALAGMATKTAQAADTVHKASQRMGVSTQAYQEMDYWASQNGISQQDMEKAVGRLNQRMGMAEAGNKKYTEAFKALGVGIKDAEGNMKSTESVMAESITSLSKIENGSEKAALASELFGVKLGRELMPALNDGALSMEDAAKIANDMGLVMSDSAISAGVAFQDNMDTAKRALSGITREIGAAVLPILNTMLEWVLGNLPAIKNVFSTAFGAIKIVFDIVANAVQGLIGWFESFKTSTDITFTGIKDSIQEKMTAVWQTMQEIWLTIQELWAVYGEQLTAIALDIFTRIWETISTIMTTLWETISTIWRSIYVFWQENGRAILENAITIFTQIWETISLYMGYAQEIFTKVMGYIVPFVQEQLAKIQAFWEQNGEKIMSAIEVAFSFIQSVIETVMPIISTIIDSAWQIISSIFDTAIDIIMGLVDTFASLLTGDFEGAKEAVTGIWGDLWDGIKGVVDGAWSLMSGAFSSLWSSIKGWFTGLVDDALGWGKNMIGGFIDGIKEKIGGVGDAVSGVTSTVSGWLGFNSPADKGEGRHIVEWGANMIDGFLDGVYSKQRDAQQAVNDIVGAMQPSRLNPVGLNINGSLANSKAQINSSINHEIGNSRMENLLDKIAQGQTIVLDTGELVGGTYPAYDREGGNQTKLTERWRR